MNYLSIDLESFTHINIHNNLTSEQRKHLDNGWIVDSVNEVLQILKENEVKVTFFVISEIYNFYPDLIHKIKSEGHEIAWHTSTHQLLKYENILIKQLELSRNFLKEFECKGFRAPQMLFYPEYYKILKENNFKYDSSTYGKDSFMYDGIKEYPVTTIKPIITIPSTLTMKTLFSGPIGSAFMFALCGKSLSKEITKQEYSNQDYFFFIHNWQISKVPFWQKIKIIMKDPRMILYLRNRKIDFQYLLASHHFTKYESNL